MAEVVAVASPTYILFFQWIFSSLVSSPPFIFFSPLFDLAAVIVMKYSAEFGQSILFYLPFFAAVLCAWLGALCLSFIVVRYNCSWPFTAPVAGAEALLVIAHPDDEAMFFVPSVVALQNAGWAVRLLCLSAGRGGGDGEVRKAEAISCGGVLGLAAVEVMDDARLPDGMDTNWQTNVVVAAVRGALRRSPRVRLLLTFDAQGISGHANHTAVHAGLCELLRGGGPLPPCYSLETVSLPRKFSSIFDALPSALATWVRNARSVGGKTERRRRRSDSSVPAAVIVGSTRPLLSHAAMAAHASQYVWFRRYFVCCSRHTFINTLTRLDL